MLRRKRGRVWIEILVCWVFVPLLTLFAALTGALEGFLL